MVTGLNSSKKWLFLTLLLLFISFTAGLKDSAAQNGRLAASLNHNGSSVVEKAEIPSRNRKLRVVATGYTAGVESTGKRPGHPQYGITYSGVKVRRDHVSTIAADLSVFPIGTLMYIPGYGYGVVADTGSAIKGNKIDLYFESTQQVYKQWGKRAVFVEILRKGQGKLTEAWLSKVNAAVKADRRIPQSMLAT